MDPRECSVCHRSFCLHCINKWRQLKDYCPSLCRGMNFEQPHPFIKQSLSNLKVQCPFEGCSETLNYEAYKKHTDQCKLKNIFCAFCAHSVCK